jgi:hemerythrin-like metal-binding protein
MLKQDKLATEDETAPVVELNIDYKLRYQRMTECRTAVKSLLSNNVLPLSLSRQLELALESLRDIPWLKIRFEGAVFLKNTRDDLILVAEKDLAKPLHQLCSSIRPGHCLCGRVLQSGETLFASSVDHRHETRFDGMCDHGHYILPLKDGKEIIGVLNIYTQHAHTPAIGEQELLEDFASAMASLIVRRQAEDKIIARQLELLDSQSEVLNRLSLAAEHRDSETGAHTVRMAHYATIIARKAGLSAEQLNLLQQAAPLHDVGKIGIRDEILLKPGPLTAEEFEGMKQHTVIGAAILKGGGALIDTARTIAISHHERFDGSGYPYGLAGEAIPLLGRICAIADVFDALTMRRPYKESWEIDKARAFILEKSGSHFDPAIVAAFVDGFDEIIRIKTLFSDETIDPHVVLNLPQIEGAQSEYSLWKDEYSVGIDSIDEHHRYLLQLIARLEDSVLHSEGIFAVNKAMNALHCYANIHFREEERMMQHYNYPLLDGHRKMHRFFQSRLQGFRDDLKNNPLVIGHEVVQFLHDWFITHIQKEDRKIITLIDHSKSRTA